MDIDTPLRIRIRISDGNGWAAGVEGIYLGYNANYDTVKVGFVDTDGNYTGEGTRVSRSAATVADETPADAPTVIESTNRVANRKAPAPQPAPTGNVTITVPADTAVRLIDDLKRVRAQQPDLSTGPMYVARVRLEDALSALPQPSPVSGATVPVEDVTDPCETTDDPSGLVFPDPDFVIDVTPVPVDIVTRVTDLDPDRRYALWVCDRDNRHGCGVRCSAHSLRATGTGAEIATTMDMYNHRYAQRLDT